MLLRYFRLYEFIQLLAHEDPGLIYFLPTPVQDVRIRECFEFMKIFESITKALQESKELTCSDTRDMFEAIGNDYPVLLSHCAVDSTVIHSPEFENAVVKIM